VSNFAEFADEAYALKDNYLEMNVAKREQLETAENLTEAQKELAKEKEELAKQMAELEEKRAAIKAKEELANAKAPYISYDDIEDVSYTFQERLEYDYWVYEQNEYILDLQQQIELCRQGVDKEALEAFDVWNSIPEDEGYYTSDGRHTWDFEESIGE